MLAYVFWHRPAPGVVAADYEAPLDAFHHSIGVPSAWFAVRGLPWIPDGGDGYEDWYLVDDFTALGELNERAVSGPRQVPHDAAAAAAAWGIAGLYLLKRGEPRLDGVRFAAWRAKPAGVTYDAFEASLPGRAAWQRQMTLGPTPEYVLHDDAGPLQGEPSVAYAPTAA
ncbi:hypothetical protein [Capillimicrobium parvum]|uniref:Uncharacterized protein n=1 Tax=Capillimicrobium parvum TaxID=2884022 RepID=A0A9E6XWK4_9ACTN|nr:hypothetical protein [Capillimicrobium parvum]UGS35423.1 hypothetical protein DSM104329_01811 [Capillimicrobium parvum]